MSAQGVLAPRLRPCDVRPRRHTSTVNICAACHRSPSAPSVSAQCSVSQIREIIKPFGSRQRYETARRVTWSCPAHPTYISVCIGTFIHTALGLASSCSTASAIQPLGDYSTRVICSRLRLGLDRYGNFGRSAAAALLLRSVASTQVTAGYSS